MPLGASGSAAGASFFTCPVRVGAGPNVLANRATALVTADDASSCPLLVSAAGSLRLSAGARPSGEQKIVYKPYKIL